MSSSNLDRHLRSTGNCAPRQVPTQIIELAKKWNIPLSATEKVACETTVVRTRLGNKSVTFLSHDNDDSIPRYVHCTQYETVVCVIGVNVKCIHNIMILTIHRHLL